MSAMVSLVSAIPQNPNTGTGGTSSVSGSGVAGSGTGSLGGTSGTAANPVANPVVNPAAVDPSTVNNARPVFNTYCGTAQQSAAYSACYTAIQRVMANMTGTGWRSFNAPNDTPITIYNNTHFTKTEHGDPSDGGNPTCLVTFAVNTGGGSRQVAPSLIYSG